MIKANLRSIFLGLGYFALGLLMGIVVYSVYGFLVEYRLVHVLSISIFLTGLALATFDFSGKEDHWRSLLGLYLIYTALMIYIIHISIFLIDIFEEPLLK